ncbi:hypothetical protein BRC70_05255 [Halobacteriales archaeon QH_6_68_27]|nr:MAG: hypothetical protein BRC70_05255 [Halobacteriales archaeon QH_6_68_27]
MGTDTRAGSDGTGAARPPDVDALLERARETLDRERRRTADERDAFADLHDRLRAVRPVSARPSGPVAGGPVASVADATTDAAADRLATVREAYRETVMAVPHFDAEYGESYAESVTEEFGPAIAAPLVGGDRFDDRYRRALLEAAEEGRSRRATLVDALDAERESLATHRERIRSIRERVAAVAPGSEGAERAPAGAATDGANVTASFGALSAARSTLAALEERCDTVAADRQADVHEHARRLSLSVETVDVPTYCYGPLPVSYPVLSAVTAVGERVERQRRAVERAIATYSGT